MKKWFLLHLLAAIAPVHAQSADPTRPPAAWLTPAGASSLAGEEDSSAAGRLQSVLIPQRGKPVAIIGGRTVVLGGRVGEATLVRLTEREAVLQGADGVTRLYLTPGIEKQLVAAPAAATRHGKIRQFKGSP